ncbi:hypothetical protein LTR84_011501 [Exophiala bonariae]|uniref:DUF1365 domain-containing protein n=1 Tax=Exophiala bonariae TaxID=1690606 RepID=A0AAV9NIL5_9EURO|nr:hypothetical protein LTR84_011501 [Exophiala bonariae]
MQVVRHIKATAIALFLSNWRSIFWTLRSLKQQHYAALIIVVIASQTAWLLLHNNSQKQEGRVRANTGSVQDSLLSPRIFECRTTHTRLFPKKHSFAYSYLLVGVPIGWRGTLAHIISSDIPVSKSSAASFKAWFSVQAEDYLGRGGHSDGLAGKLRDYLTTQNVSIDDYPYAYLVTAPRFLGFSFNPVSFWYLYDANKGLAAMILEVNNTFDERRMYFLPRHDLADAQTSTRFVQQWGKDFHVSPFNDREGSYSLSAVDPFESHHQIDNNIVLSSEDGKPKVIARVYSTKPGLIPASMSAFDTISFLARWGWVGFMTNPRILREARVLWAKGLQVFYRPEVMKTSISRNPSIEETSIEPVFDVWLQRLSAQSGTTIEYTSGVKNNPIKTICPENEDFMKRFAAQPEAIEIKILTPAFYSELARDPDLQQIFERLCFNAGPGEAMAYVSNPEQFHRLLKISEYNTLRTAVSFGACIMQTLRSGTCSFLVTWLQGKRGLTSVHPGASTIKQCSSLDEYIETMPDPQQVIDYEKACLKILLADRFALGFTPLLKFYMQFAWLVSFLLAISHVNQWLHGSRGYEIRDIFSFGIKTLAMLVMG